MTTLSLADLDEMERLAKAADCKGAELQFFRDGAHGEIRRRHPTMYEGSLVATGLSRRDAEYFAGCSPERIEALVEEVKRLRAAAKPAVTITEEMVERGARAIAAANDQIWERLPVTPEDAVSSIEEGGTACCQHDYLNEARACLSAALKQEG